MARRKHHAKKHTSRRRRHSSMHGISGMATNAVAVIAGGVAAQFIGNMIDKMATTNTTVAQYKSYIEAGIPIAVGLYLPKLVKSEIGKNIGTGMIAVGGVKLFQGLGVVSGMPAVSGYKRMALAPSQAKIAGPTLTTHKAAVLTA
jgi:hypothetical protein